MIKIEKIQVYGWEAAIRGMRNPMNSWDKIDSHFEVDCTKCGKIEREGFCVKKDSDCRGFECCVLGPNDYNLAKNLINAGTDHSKFMRMIHVSMDIIAPEYWWKEYATYKVGTVENSTSTMHKIQAKEFTLDDFSHEHLNKCSIHMLNELIHYLNSVRDLYNNGFNPIPGDGVPIDKHDKNYWWQMIQLLPMSYNYRRTVSLSYQNLQNMYQARNNHKLDEWREFCKIIEQDFPYSEFITKKF